MQPQLNRIYLGDVLATLKTWPDSFVQTVVTSPPYWGLRDYGVPGQIGLEPTPEQFIAKLVEVFREVRRVLRKDGTLWVNMGDSYNNYAGNRGTTESINRSSSQAMPKRLTGHGLTAKGYKNKDLIGQPWMLAFALRADGWYLRQDIIWNKPAPMPESCKDRCTKAHEYVFLLTKSPRYHWDAAAISEPASYLSHARGSGVHKKVAGWAEGAGTHTAIDHAQPKKDLELGRKLGRGAGWRTKQNASFSASVTETVDRRNKRSVWTIPTEPFAEAHFATFPQKLVAPCILAGCPPGGVVLDPFMGAGTTALVAAKLGRNFLGCELNPEYLAIAEKRIAPEMAQHKIL